MGTPSTQTLRATPMTLSPSIRSPRRPPATAGMSLRWEPDLDAVPELAPTSPDHSCLPAEHTQSPGPPDGRHAKSICCILQCIALQERSRRSDVCRISGELACTWHAPLGRYMRPSTQVSSYLPFLVINPCWAFALPPHLHFWRSASALRWMQIQRAKLCMPSQQFAVRLQTDCMVLVPAPTVRLPDSHMYA